MFELFLAFFPILIGSVVMMGWFLHLAPVLQIHPSFAPMQFNTALLLVCGGCALLGLLKKRFVISNLFSLLVAGMGGLTFLQYLFGFEFHIDQLFLTAYLPATPTHPGRMGSNTALCFFMVGVALLFLGAPNLGFFRRLSARLLGAAVLSFALLSLFALFASGPLTYGWGNYSSMAVHTAICMGIIGVGAIVQSSRGELNQIKGRSNYYPILSVVLILTGTVCLWQSSLYYQTKETLTRTQSLAESLSDQLFHGLDDRMKSVARMAKRIEANPAITEKIWRADASEFLKDLTVLEVIAVISPEYRLKWVQPEVEKYTRLIGTDFSQIRKNVMDLAIQNRGPEMSSIVELKAGGHGVVVYAPIFKNDRFGGFVSASMFPENFIRKILDLKGYELELKSGNDTIFSNFSANPTFISQWAVEVPFQISHQSWKLRLVPTIKILKEGESGVPYTILFVGIFIALMAGFLIHVMINSNFLAKTIAEQKNAVDQIISSSPLPMVVLDLNKRVTVWNSSAEQAFGWKASEVIGKFLPVVPEDLRESSNAIIDKMLEGKEKLGAKVPRIKKDGSRIMLYVSGVALKNESGQVTGLVAIMDDITERNRIETEIRLAKLQAEHATRAKSDFLANMSHEIRTPLNGVIGMSVILAETELSKDQRQYVNLIEASANALLALVNDVLDFSKIEANKILLEEVEVSLEKVVESSIQTLQFAASQKGLTLNFKIDSDLPSSVVGDPTRLRQILMNLLSNSIKFTDRGGVEIKVTPEEKGCMRFSVTDTGIGIAPEAQSKVFESFTQADATTTRKYGGTGLGLWICKHLVELMGGEIGIESELGKGTTFWFVIPAILLPEKNIQKVVEKSLPVVRPLKVLVADDNSVNRLVAVNFLQSLGHSTKEAKNGREAVDLLAAQVFDFVLMDCQMPEMDGYEATRAIRATVSPYQQIPIVALTANARLEDREKCMASGMNDYISKPMKKSDLAHAIVRLFFV